MAESILGFGLCMAGGRAGGLCPDPSLLPRLPYNEFFGGVSGLTVEQFQKINGFPNAFWGWGGEDDDLWNRWGFCQLGWHGLRGDNGHRATGAGLAVPACPRLG